MGLFDWGLNKLQKKVDEEFLKEDTNLIKTDEIEKATYSDYSYKNVKKLREKGKYWGIDVPFLQHPLIKREKPRALFIVLGIVSLILLGFVLYGAYVAIRTLIIPLIATALPMNDLFKVQEWDIFGLFAMFISLAPIITWLIIALISAVVISIVVYFVYLTRKMFCLSKISMQEVAKGYEVKNLIVVFGFVLGIVLVGGIALLVNCAKNMTATNIAIVVGIMLGILLVVGTVFALLLVQRIKENKEFAKLPLENQQDFIKHNRQLERVKSRKNKSKSILSSSEVDF